jgi:hypothetical protein
MRHIHEIIPHRVLPEPAGGKATDMTAGKIKIWRFFRALYRFFGRPWVSLHASKRRELYTHITTGAGLISLFTDSLTAFLFGIVASVFGGIIALRQHGRIFGRIWNIPVGKVIYAILALITVQVGQILSDSLLQRILQTSPELFPALQKVTALIPILTLWVASFILIFTMSWIIGLCIVILRNFIATFAVARKHRYYALGQFIFALSFVMAVVPNFYTSIDEETGIADLVGNVVMEAAFAENEQEWMWQLDESRGVKVTTKTLVCNNLPDDSYVLFAKNSEAIFPNQVLEAYKIQDKTGDTRQFLSINGIKYSLRRSPCDNSLAPGQPRVLTTEEALSPKK